MTTSYDLPDVPERGDGRARFALPTSPSGIDVRPAQAANLAYGRLLRERAAGLGSLSPAPKTIKLKRIACTVDGSYATVDCHREITVVPTHTAVRTGRFSKPRLAGGAFLDDFYLGGDSWTQAHDDQVYEAALQHAATEGIQGNDLRTLNELIQLAILARAGCPTIPSWELPL